MPRIALLNMLIGFVVLALAAAAGSFIAFDITEGYLKDKALLDSWQLTLMSSSHGHTNLFATLHILMGLTMPYSSWSLAIKKGQTAGLLAGTFAMGPLMMMRAYVGPTEGIDLLEVAIGGCLSLALATLVVHAAGLGRKLSSRV